MKKVYKLPLEDVNEDSAIITKFYYNSGDFVANGEIIYSFETTKTSEDIASENDGFIFYLVEEESTYKVGTEICLITSDKSFTQKDNITTQKNLNKIEKKMYSLTKKAQALVEESEIDLTNFELSGIIREKDILELLNSIKIDLCEECPQVIFLETQNEFTERLLNDHSLKQLTSEEKVELYRKNDHSIGENVSIENGSILISDKIIIEDNVTIGKNTVIESPTIHIKRNTKIGIDCQFVSSSIIIGRDNYIGNNVFIDISGGRYVDSSFISGIGCLISNDVYINVCHQVKLGDEVALSPRAMIFTHSYWQSVLDGYSSNFGPVEMKNNSWLGAAAQILPNVVAGEGSIIISNSVVNKNVRDFSLVGGIPAVQLRENIKKNLTVAKQISELESILRDFVQYLREIGCLIESYTDNSVTFMEGKERRVIRLIINEDINFDKFDIILSYKNNQKIKKLSNTFFCIEDKYISGTLSYIENVLLNFLRRRGLRFYK